MRLTSHVHVSAVSDSCPCCTSLTIKSHPFISFCLYVAARVFSHAYKKQRNDDSLRRNLDFLLNAMQAHRRKNPLTESFLVQLTVDLEAAGIPTPPDYTRQSYSLTKATVRDSTMRHLVPILTGQNEIFLSSDKCPPVFQPLSETQPTYHELRSKTNSRTSSLHGVNLEERPPQASTQYSITPFTVPTRERRAHMDGLRSYNVQGTQMQGVVLSNNWNADPRNNAVVDPYHIFDADMSSEDTSDPIGLSGPTTTSNSHRASSRTSYSPSIHDVDALEGSHGSADHALPGGQPPYYQSSPYPTYTSSENYISQQPTSNDFVVPAGWELGAETIPTSVSEQGWAQVFEGMTWSDGNSIGDGMEGWRQMPASNHGLTR